MREQGAATGMTSAKSGDDWAVREFSDHQDWSERGPVIMGPSATHTWRTDPRRLPITLSRYKHVAKLLAGKQRALEIGCGDGFHMRLILQTVPAVHGVELNPLYVKWATQHAQDVGLNCTFSHADVTRAQIPGSYDAVYSTLT